jgi:hypothetical protein
MVKKLPKQQLNNNTKADTKKESTEATKTNNKEKQKT